MLRHAEISDWGFYTLLGLSFFPFLIRGFIYLPLGSYLPLAVPVILGIPIVYFAAKQSRQLSGFVKLWAAFLLLYAAARLILGLALQYEPVAEAYIADQITYGFTLTNFGYIAAGLYFWRNVQKRINHF